MCSLLAENAAQRKEIEELTSRLNQNSKNSNRSSSSDSTFKKPTSRQETTAKPGARKGHEGHGPVLLNPSKVVPVKPGRCECGNSDFHKTHPYYTHQKVEFPHIELLVTHFVLLEGICPRCDKLVKAAIPKEHATGYVQDSPLLLPRCQDLIETAVVLSKRFVSPFLASPSVMAPSREPSTAPLKPSSRFMITSGAPPARSKSTIRMRPAGIRTVF